MENTLLITGASSGIGREFAHIHAENGGDIVIVARREELLLTLKSELEEKEVKVKVIVKDLTEPDAVKSIYEELKAEGIQIDFLINNAGFGLRGNFVELPWEQQHQMMQLNMIALSEMTYLFVNDFVKRNKGKILNVSSTASLMPGPLQAVYFASKAYVAFLNNALAEELRNTKITVTNLMPGATESEFAKTSGMDKTALFRKTSTARSVAEAGYEGMLKGKLDVIAGVSFSQKILFKMIPLLPKKMLLKQIRKMQEV
ncbi:short-chain dehydrogenase [Putridiphycobacter roseus]|uniref:Short-chain dehydrogenase n=1 Tax=Putridiphycobacter roseus TaxID=2219161 RepID=A0A2W1NG97_9FLAO|nr:SDR family oxidoreductase [Putridiphycobacter roseus]PZE18123.1 short-chain dehydrogenase [Putridiphycobacter roseus]